MARTQFTTVGDGAAHVKRLCPAPALVHADLHMRWPRVHIEGARGAVTRMHPGTTAKPAETMSLHRTLCAVTAAGSPSLSQGPGPVTVL